MFSLKITGRNEVKADKFFMVFINFFGLVYFLGWKGTGERELLNVVDINISIEQNILVLTHNIKKLFSGKQIF